jgi:glucosamine--fructose-6-phosphate aminotransferase (isomerizing)
VSQTFMAAEIAEAGAVVRRQLAANSALTAKLAADLRALKPAFVATVARGSSDHAALYLKHLVELKLGLACASLGPSIASLYHAPLKLEGAVAIAISQSGRSPDILAMQRAARDQRAMTIAFVNDEESPLAREANAVLPLRAGPERSVAATKSMIAALTAGASLAAHWSGDAELLAALTKLPSVLDSSSAAPPATEAIETLTQASSLFVIGHPRRSLFVRRSAAWAGGDHSPRLSRARLRARGRRASGVLRHARPARGVRRRAAPRRHRTAQTLAGPGRA